MSTERLTVAQALVRFLAAQHIERDGRRHRFFAGCLGIFGHGNVAGLGQALQQHHDLLPYHPARNEQAMVHVASGYARQRNRLGAFACTSSVGPGATNMVTGAALATVNRLPVLLLPGDTFANRGPHPVLQQLEAPHDGTISVNDCFRPVCRFFDRINRPEQLVDAALAAMRVLTDPAETGAVCLALPEDVQTEVVEVPAAFLDERTWTVFRRPPAPDALARAAELVRARAPAAGRRRRRRRLRGGDRRAARVRRGDRDPGRRDAGRPRRAAVLAPVGARRDRRDRHAGGEPARARGRPRDRRRHALERLHDRLEVRVPGPRRPVRQRQRRPVRRRQAQRARGRGRRAAGARRRCARRSAAGAPTPPGSERAAREAAAWDEEVARLYGAGHAPLPSQAEVIGAVNDAAGERDVVVCAAGSMPGDLHKLWRTTDPDGKGYHVEYGYSCMGYEIAGRDGRRSSRRPTARCSRWSATART